MANDRRKSEAKKTVVGLDDVRLVVDALVKQSNAALAALILKAKMDEARSDDLMIEVYGYGGDPMYDLSYFAEKFRTISVKPNPTMWEGRGGRFSGPTAPNWAALVAAARRFADAEAVGVIGPLSCREQR